MKINLKDLEINSFSNVLSNDEQLNVKGGMPATDTYTGVTSMCNATSDTKNAAQGVSCPLTMQSAAAACRKEVPDTIR